MHVRTIKMTLLLRQQENIKLMQGFDLLFHWSSFSFILSLLLQLAHNYIHFGFVQTYGSPKQNTSWA